MHDAVFHLRDVVKSRPGADRFRLVIERFTLRRGEAVALVGQSGCGKSTALDLLSCALRPDDGGGEFTFSPTEDKKADVLKSWAAGGINALADLRMRYLGYVLQTGGLLPFLTAADNILLACKTLNCVHSRVQAIRDMVGAGSLGIEEQLRKYPSQLSVGQRQRVAIAKALAHDPTVVLADEPTAALDPEHSRLVMSLFLDLARTQGSTVVMVSHDQDLAAELGFTLVPVTVRSGEDGVTATIHYEGAPEAESDDATDTEPGAEPDGEEESAPIPGTEEEQ